MTDKNIKKYLKKVLKILSRTPSSASRDMHLKNIFGGFQFFFYLHLLSHDIYEPHDTRGREANSKSLLPLPLDSQIP